MTRHELIMAGEIEAVHERLKNEANEYEQILGMFSTVLNNMRDKETGELLKKLSKRDIMKFGVNFKQISTAALDVLEFEKYTGNDDYIKSFISTKFKNVFQK